MTPEERIATLILHECKFVRKDPNAEGILLSWRAIVDPLGIALTWSPISLSDTSSRRWVHAQFGQFPFPKNVEIDWEVGLIELISDEMFSRYINLLDS